MDRGAAVRLRDLVVIDFAQPVVGCDGAGIGQDQSAHGIGHRGIFLYTPVVDAQIVIHQVFIVQEGGIDITDFLALFPVQNIGLGHVSVSRFGKYLFHAVLDAFNGDFPIGDQRFVFRRDPQGQHVDHAGMVLLFKSLKRLRDRF